MAELTTHRDAAAARQLHERRRCRRPADGTWVEAIAARRVLPEGGDPAE